MQHYGWQSPLIDVTGTIDVAAFFAWTGRSPDDLTVIYVFEAAVRDAEIEFVDHDFLLSDLNSDGLKCRCLRQDGYAMPPKKRVEMDSVLEFDLSSSPRLVDKMLFAFELG